MHLFHTPWLRNDARSNSSSISSRRTGTARRVAALLQYEAANKPLQLESAPQAVIIAPEATATTTSIAA